MFTYLDENGEKKASKSSGDILLGQTQEFDPGDYGGAGGCHVLVVRIRDLGLRQRSKAGFHLRKGKPGDGGLHNYRDHLVQHLGPDRS